MESELWGFLIFSIIVGLVLGTCIGAGVYKINHYSQSLELRILKENCHIVTIKED